MAYATSANVTDRDGSLALVRVADRDGDDVADTAAVTAALDDGAALMDGIIGRRYLLPLAVAPPWFVRCNVDLAICFLAGESRGSNTKQIMARHDMWIKRLDMVANGMMSFGLGADEPATHFEPDIESDTPVLQVSDTAGII